MSKRTYVVDTSVLIADPDVLLKLGGCTIVVPMAAIGELDRFKRSADAQDPRAKAARRVTRILDALGTEQDISTGARTPSGSSLMIYRSHAAINGLSSSADNKVIGAAVKIRNAMRTEVVVLSNDRNMRNVSRAYGITATAYPFSAHSSPASRNGKLGDMAQREKTDSHAMDKSRQNARSSWVYFLIPVAVIIFLALLTGGR